MMERFRPHCQAPWGPTRNVVKNGRLAFAMAILLTATGAAAQSAGASQIHIAHEPVALHREDPDAQHLGALTYIGGLRLSSPDARFGGFSGLIVSSDGRHMTAVSDRGNLLEAKINYDGGKLVGVSEARMCPLKDRWGNPIAGLQADAEAVLRLGDGALAVSFERDHRIVRYAADQGLRPCDSVGAARLLHRADDWRAMPVNGGLEAMTLLKDETLFALSEDARTPEGLIKGWLIRERKSAPVFYRPTGKFKPTDMLHLSTGDLLVLERRFSLMAGVASRLCLIEGVAVQAGATLECKSVAQIVSPSTTENYEGLAARTTADGGTVVYLLSDDNFNALQSTILMMFRLDLGLD